MKTPLFHISTSFSTLMCFFALCLLGFSSCGDKKTSTSAGALPSKMKTKQLLSQLEENLVEPQAMELRGTARINSASTGNQSVSVVIRSQPGKGFWVTARKFGIEGARMLVTPDSVFAVNRLKREALRASTAELRGKAGILPVDLTLENLIALIGGYPIGEWSKAKTERFPGQYLLHLPSEPNVELTISARPQLLTNEWNYEEGNNYGDLRFSKFKPVEGTDGLFPHLHEIAVSKKPGDTTLVQLDLKSVELKNKLSLPMSIPANYGKMKL